MAAVHRAVHALRCRGRNHTGHGSTESGWNERWQPPGVEQGDRGPAHLQNHELVQDVEIPLTTNKNITLYPEGSVPGPWFFHVAATKSSYKLSNELRVIWNCGVSKNHICESCMLHRLCVGSFMRPTQPLLKRFPSKCGCVCSTQMRRMCVRSFAGTSVALSSQWGRVCNDLCRYAVPYNTWG